MTFICGAGLTSKPKIPSTLQEENMLSLAGKCRVFLRGRQELACIPDDYYYPNENMQSTNKRVQHQMLTEGHGPIKQPQWRETVPEATAPTTTPPPIEILYGSLLVGKRNGMPQEAIEGGK